MGSRVTKIPGFSGVLPAGTDPALATKINAMVEAIDVRLGRRGDPLDRAVTLRELVESGLVVPQSGALFNPNTPRPGFLPFSAFTDRSIPPQPTGVTATGGYSIVTVFWDFPLYGNHSYAEIYRNSANVIGDAVLVGTSGGRSFVDPVGGSASYYYWVRFISTSNVPGPFHATLGDSATTASDVSELLDVLTGAVSASQLTEGLLEMIDGAGSAIDLAALQVFTGYDAGYTGDPLLDLIDVNTALLDDVKDFAGYTGGYTGDSLITRMTAAEGVNTTQTTNITTLQTTVNHGTTGVAATASALGALTTRVTTAEGTIVTQGSAITALETTVNHGTTGVAATASALGSLTTRVTTAEGTITTQGSAITTLQSTVNHGTTGVAATAAAVSALGVRVTAAEGTITTQSSAITALQTTVNHGTTGVAATASALSTLTTTVSTNTGNISTLSGQYTSLSTTVGGHTTTISSHTSSINGLNAEYMVKINANGRVTGFGLVGGATSAFYIIADQFAIVSPYSNIVTAVPFVVQTTTTTVGGVSVPAGVYIDSAFVMNGTITNAKIANAAIDDAKITTLSANKITTGTLDTSRLNIDGVTLIAVAGVLKLGTVSISNLTAGSITADYIAANGINLISAYAGGSVSMPTDASTDTLVASGSLNKESGTGSPVIIDYQIDLGATGSGNFAFYVYVFCDGNLIRTFYHLMARSFTHTVQGKTLVTGLAAGGHTYTITAQANVSGGGISGVTVSRTDMIVTEVKR